MDFTFISAPHKVRAHTAPEQDKNETVDMKSSGSYVGSLSFDPDPS